MQWACPTFQPDRHRKSNNLSQIPSWQIAEPGPEPDLLTHLFQHARCPELAKEQVMMMVMMMMMTMVMVTVRAQLIFIESLFCAKHCSNCSIQTP